MQGAEHWQGTGIIERASAVSYDELLRHQMTWKEIDNPMRRAKDTKRAMCVYQGLA